MKKVTMMFFAVAMMVSFAACDGNKKQEQVVEEEVVVTIEDVVEEPAAPTKTPAEMLKEFQDYVKEYAEANNNKSKNITKYTQLGRRSTQMVAEMEAIKEQLTDKQKKEYEKAKEVIVKINSVSK